MSTFHHIPSPNDTATAKVKDPWQCMEDNWALVSEAELNPVLSNDKGTARLCKREKERQLEREAEERGAHKEVMKKAWEEAERQAKEVCKAQEEVVKKEREEREAAAQKAWEAAEAWADAEWRALEERLWDMAAQHSETVAAPLQVAKPGGRMMSVAGPSVPG
ncbi:hypothetical protein ID866_11122 [Astraeus odoratus]|nr:hypothetical protein ID866_11122 [Astraeus odoratus]